MSNDSHIDHWLKGTSIEERAKLILKLTSIEIILSKLLKQRLVYSVHFTLEVEVLPNLTNNERALDQGGYALFLFSLPF